MPDIKLIGRDSTVTTASVKTPQTGDIAKIDVNTEVTGTLGITNAGNTGTFSAGSLSSNRTYTLPDTTGTLALTSDISSGVTVGTGGDYATVAAALNAGESSLIVLNSLSEDTIVANTAAWASKVLITLQSGVSWTIPNGITWTFSTNVGINVTSSFEGNLLTEETTLSGTYSSVILETSTGAASETKFIIGSNKVSFSYSNLLFKLNTSKVITRSAGGSTDYFEDCRIELHDSSSGSIQYAFFENCVIKGGGTSCGGSVVNCGGDNVFVIGGFILNEAFPAIGGGSSESWNNLEFSSTASETYVQVIKISAFHGVNQHLRVVEGSQIVAKTITLISGSLSEYGTASNFLAQNIYYGGNKGFASNGRVTSSSQNFSNLFLSNIIITGVATIAATSPGSITGAVFDTDLTVSGSSLKFNGCSFLGTLTVSGNNNLLTGCSYASTPSVSGTGNLFSSSSPISVDSAKKTISFAVTAPTSDVAIVDGAVYFVIPDTLNGMNILRAQASVVTAGTTNPTTVDVYNVTDSTSVLSSLISIASGNTVGTPGTINTSVDDVSTDDMFKISVTAVSGTAPKGLIVTLTFGYGL